MSVRVKTVVILAALFAGLVIANAVVLQAVIVPGFRDMERESAERDMRRVLETLSADLDALDLLNADWAAWDDTYAFVQGSNPEFVAINMTPALFKQARLNLLIVLDMDGHMVWGSGFDRARNRLVAATEFVPHGFVNDRALLGHPNEKSAVTGLVRNPQGPLMVSSRPIITSRHAGPLRGTLVMGRLLDEAAVDDLGRRLHVDVRARPVEAMAVPNIRSMPPPVEVELLPDGETLAATTTVADLAGVPILRLAVVKSRDIVLHGERALRYAVALLGIVGVAMLVGMLYVLQRVIIGPLRRLADHVASLTEAGKIATPLPLDRDDDVGRIAREFKALQDRIARFTHVDALTGLPNRVLFIDRAEQVLRLARRQERLAAVFFIDLDRFRVIAEIRGHATSERLLRAVAKRLEDGLRICDTISHFGDDEFAVIGHGMRDAEEVAVVGRKILALFASPFHVGEELVAVTPSIGISIFPDHGEDVEALLRQANAATLQAREQGRNRYTFFTPDLAG